MPKIENQTFPIEKNVTHLPVSSVEAENVLTDTSASTSGEFAQAIRRFGFSIGNFNFLVKEGLYCELLIDINISPLPNSPRHLRGLANLRGNIIPVYSIHELLGIKKPQTTYTFLIGAPNDGAALQVDRKPILVDLTDIKQKPPEENYTSKNYIDSSVDATFSIDKYLWHSLDHENLFSKLAMPIAS